MDENASVMNVFHFCVLTDHNLVKSCTVIKGERALFLCVCVPVRYSIRLRAVIFGGKKDCM